MHNAPYFLLVLLAMQRFDSVDWGIPKGFPDAAPGDDPVSLPGSVELVSWRNPLHQSFQLSGRSTVVLEGRTRTSPEAVKAVKIPHRERSRLPEDHIVARALEVVSPKFPLSKHLPHCLFAEDVAHDTGWIRAFLDDDVSASLVPRLTVWEMLTPILRVPDANFGASDFVRCWLEIVHGVSRCLEPSVMNIRMSCINLAYFQCIFSPVKPRNLHPCHSEPPFDTFPSLCDPNVMITEHSMRAVYRWRVEVIADEGIPFASVRELLDAGSGMHVIIKTGKCKASTRSG